MTALNKRHLLLAFAAAPLALGLASCKKEDQAGEAPSGAQIAKIAAPAGQKWEETITQTAVGGMMAGNPAAPIKLVEYGSLSCPHCARFAAEAMTPLMTEFVSSGRVSYEYRSFYIHQQDLPLTMLVRCAPKENFFPLVEAVYANYDNFIKLLDDPKVQASAEAASKLPPGQRLPALSQALGFSSFFTAHGMSADQVNACLSNTANATAISNTFKTFADSGVQQTPTLVINGFQLPPESSEWPKVAEALRAAGAR